MIWTLCQIVTHKTNWAFLTLSAFISALPCAVIQNVSLSTLSHINKDFTFCPSLKCLKKEWLHRSAYRCAVLVNFQSRIDYVGGLCFSMPVRGSYKSSFFALELRALMERCSDHVAISQLRKASIKLQTNSFKSSHQWRYLQLIYDQVQVLWSNAIL